MPLRYSVLRFGLAAGAEEGAQELTGFLAIAAIDDRAMMTGGLGKEARPVLDRPTLGIGGRVDKPIHARKADGAGAHGTWLERYVEVGTDQTLIVVQLGAGAEHQHFRVCRGIVQLHDAVAAFGDNLLGTGTHEDGANRDLAARRRRPRLVKGES